MSEKREKEINLLKRYSEGNVTICDGLNLGAEEAVGGNSDSQAPNLLS